MAGKQLVARAAETLAEVLERVVIVSSRVPAAGEWAHVRDLREGLGPLAGIEAALAHAAELGLGGAFVLACDLPLVDAATVRSVLGALGPEALAAAPKRVGGAGVEPLCAAYRMGCLPAVRSALDRGALAVHRVFVEVGGVTVSIPGEVLLNVNRPADGERAAAALRHRER